VNARLIVAAVALLAGGVAAAGEPAPAPATPASGAATAGKEPVRAREARAEPRPASWSGTQRPRVTPGVLVRAAKRAQQRDPGVCRPCGACGAHGGTAAEHDTPASIEIEWHAASAAP
jgi:hypothetical protein